MSDMLLHTLPAWMAPVSSQPADAIVWQAATQLPPVPIKAAIAAMRAEMEAGKARGDVVMMRVSRP